MFLLCTSWSQTLGDPGQSSYRWVHKNHYIFEKLLGPYFKLVPYLNYSKKITSLSYSCALIGSPSNETGLMHDVCNLQDPYSLLAEMSCFIKISFS